MSKKRKTNTKLLSALLALLLLVASLPISGLTAFAKNPRYGDFEYYVDDGSVRLIGYHGNEMSLILPPEIDGCPVTQLGDDFLANYDGLTDVTIYDSLNSIGTYSFEGCNNLKEVYFTGSEKQWKEITAYSKADSLKNATIHYNYDAQTFKPMLSDMITSGVLKYRYSYEDGTAEIYDSTVYEPTDDAAVLTIPSELDGHTVTAIGSNAFNSSALISVIIPDTVTSIGDNAFTFSLYLKSVNIPIGVTSIGKETFDSCALLSEITINKGLTNIGNGAFMGCINLTDVYFIGTEEEWNEIVIGENNDDLLNATIHFNPVEGAESANDPAENDENKTEDNNSMIVIIAILEILGIVVIIEIAGGVILFIRKKRIK